MARTGFATFLKAALLTGGLLLAAASPAFAQEGDGTAAEPPVIQRELDGPFMVVWASANLRAAPTSQSERLAQLPLGSIVTVTGEVAGGEWYRVESAEGEVGYLWRETLAPLRMDLPFGGMQGGGLQGPAVGHGSATLPPSDDNGPAAARLVELPLDGSYEDSGMVGQDDPADYYRLNVTEWAQLRITLDGLSQDADIALSDEYESEIAGSNLSGNEAELIELALAPGTYFLKVYPYGSATDYRLEISSTPVTPPPADRAGNNPAQALDLGVLTSEGIELDEWLGRSDDSDFFRFTLSAPAKIGALIENFAEDIDLYLLDERGERMIASSEAPGTQSDNLIADLQAGSYVVSVSFYGTTSSDYSLRLFLIE